jgi:hypothetical protein
MPHIEIDSTVPRIAYTATASQEDFTVPFAFFIDADLTVYIDDVLQVLDTDYTVTGAGESAGGSITLATPATGGESVVIVRDVAIERTTDFPASGPLQINSLNTQLDKLIAIDQQLQDDIVRTLRLADSDTSENLEIPIASERANKFLAFDDDGDPFVAEAVTDQPASAFGVTLIDDATRQAALVTLGVLAGRRTITGADTIVASDHGGIIEATSGTFSLAATAAATLGLGFWCIVFNSGTGTVTVDPDGAELIDGAATAGMGHGVSLLIFCTGSAFETIRLGDVSGPNGSVTDGHAAVFNGTGGKLIKTAGAAPYVVGGTDVPVTDGGTGASTAAAARTNLAVVPARAYGEYATNTDLTTELPYDDSIPQNTEGTEIITAAITLTRADSRVRITFAGAGLAVSSADDDGRPWNAALFVDSTAGALAASASGPVTSNQFATSAGGMTVCTLVHEYAPGSVGPFTFKIRVGPGSGDTMRLNGDAAGRKFGGVCKATLVVEEIFVT